MEPKFKIGDRVELLNASFGVPAGEVGTVSEISTVPYIFWDNYGTRPANQDKLKKIKSKKQETTETMEPKFKVGQRVIVRKKIIDESGKPHWVKSMDLTKDKIGVVSKVFESPGGWYVNITGDNFHSGYSYHQDWLSPAEDLDLHPKGLLIPVSELKRIYDVACGPWQRKIQGMFKPFQETVHVSAEKIEEMLKAATSTQRPIVEDVFKAYLKTLNPELFNFTESFVIDTFRANKPIFIRHILAIEGNHFKEIGFNHSEFTPVLVDKDGKETELTGWHYLKFKIKK
jgi:hypothetical protein